MYNISTLLPLALSTIALFISYLFAQGKAPRTISTNLSAISFLHKWHGLQDPTKEFLVNKLVAGAYRLRPLSDLRLPITKPILQSLIKALESLLKGYNCTLFQTMFAFAFHTYARIGEITISGNYSRNVLALSDVSLITTRSQILEAKVAFRHFKHNLTGAVHYISFRATAGPYCPVSLLIQYLRKRGNTSGMLFCDVTGNPIRRTNFDTQLKSALSFCGLSPQGYKGHSFRIGAATTAAEEGVPDSIIRLRGRWKSDAFKKYIRVATN